MSWLDNFDAKTLHYVKLGVYAVGGLIVVTLGLQLIGATFRPFMNGGNVFTRSLTPMMGTPGVTSSGLAYGESGGNAGYATDNFADMGVGLSARNMMPPSQPSPAGDSEQYEVSDRSVTIETADHERDCAMIAALKSRDYVSFEFATDHDRGCSYSFKVKRANLDEVVALLASLDPKDMTENTRTIKALVDDYTNETEVLTKKRDSIDATLRSAIATYDEITKVAAAGRDAEALARIIDSKIGVIERLTSERISIDQQLDRLARAKAIELDRVDYVYFNVYVYEKKFADGEELADSWREAVRQFVRDANASLQMATVGLLALLFLGLQYGLYALVLLFAAKYGWKLAKHVWRM